MLVEKDGSAVPDWSTGTGAVPSAIEEYRQLQFDMMFGKQFSKDRFFPGFTWVNPAQPSS
jgi:hypothetical protein